MRPRIFDEHTRPGEMRPRTLTNTHARPERHAPWRLTPDGRRATHIKGAAGISEHGKAREATNDHDEPAAWRRFGD
eukprot:5657918-Pleurochrysis_carterae.AAC.1